MPQGTWCCRKPLPPPLNLALGCCLLVATASAGEDVALAVRMETDSAQWRAWITLPHLWSRAALPPTPRWRIELRCPDGTTVLEPTQTMPQTVPAWEILLCLDRSALASLSPLALRRAVGALLALQRPEDRLVLVQYRYRAEFIHVFSGEVASAAADTLSILPAEGIAAPLHVVQAALEYCRTTPSPRHRALILLTEAPERSSFLVSAHEVVRTARQLRIPLCVLQVGLSHERSFWQALATQTGGTYGWISSPEPDLLIRRLTWLLRGLQSHYVLTFPAPRMCPELQLRFSAEHPAAVAEYSFAELPQTRPLQQLLCIFEPGDTAIGAASAALLADLAQWLQAHPAERIELIGYSGTTEPEALALQRAQNVRRRLLQLGVPAHQLRLRSEGARQPLFYFERTPAHQRGNARVELRWLRPELLPYELTVATVASEAEALRTVETWETRGYSAYYEPILRRSEPAYRVKLWGFGTEEQAQAALRRIRRLYGITPTLW